MSGGRFETTEKVGVKGNGVVKINYWCQGDGSVDNIWNTGDGSSVLTGVKGTVLLTPP